MLFRIIIVLTLLSSHLMHATTNDTLVVSLNEKLRSLDPRLAVDADSQYIEDLVHCGLVRTDENGEIAANAATSWRWLDSTKLEMNLAREIKFSDGSKLTTEDILATFRFYTEEVHSKNAQIPNSRRGSFTNLAQITSEPGKVIFHLKEPDVTFIENLFVALLPAKFALGALISEKNAAPSCGPYQLISATSQGLKLTRNPHYSLGQAAVSPNLEFKVVHDETTRYAKLIKGEIDLCQNGISLEKIPELEKNKTSLRVLKHDSLSTSYMGFNTRDSRLKDQKVRLAIAHAINKDAIISYLLKGLASKATTMLPSSNPFYNASLKDYEFNPQLSTKLLDEGGYKPNEAGIRFELTFATSQDATRVGVATAIASDLKKIGIKVNVNPLEWGRFKSDTEQGRTQVWGLSWTGFKSPDIYRFAFSTNTIPPNGANRGFFSNPDLDKILIQARSTIDLAKRKELYNQAQVLVQQGVPYVFLYHPQHVIVLNEKVRDFKIYTSGHYSGLTRAYKVSK